MTANGKQGSIRRRWRLGALGRIFYACTLLLDLLAGWGGFTLAVHSREWFRGAGLARGPMVGFAFTHYWAVLAYFAVGIVAALHYVDVYRERRFLTGNRETGRVLRAIGAFMAVNGLLAYLFPTRLLFSRLTLGASFVFISLLVLLGRWAVRRVRCALRRRRLDTAIALVVGAGPGAQALAAELLDTDHHGYRLVGLIDPGGMRGRLEGVRVFGGLERLERVIRRLHVDEVFVCVPEWGADEALGALSRLRPTGVSVRLVSHLYDSVIGRVGMPCDAIGETPILDFGDGGAHALYWRMKRVTDLVVSAFVLLVAAPVFVLVALVIWLDSGRPVLFRQKRIGMGGVPFVCYKFRSMVVGADRLQRQLQVDNEARGPMFKIREDPRMTRVGRFLRRYSLDELPQFWNIFRGEMTLVGPRPPLADEVQAYEDWQRKRLLHPMGLTGLWQVSGRNALSFEEMTLLDVFYNRNPSFFNDLRILVRTGFVILLGQGQ